LDTSFVTNLGPIQGLTRLAYLSISSSPVIDFSLLAGLTNLSTLHLISESITNIAFLANLRGLNTLALSQNLVADISPLSATVNLSTLSIDANVVSDISVLSALPAMSYVNLTYNTLNIANGSPALTVISNLQAHGATVLYQPQRSAPGVIAPPRWLINAGAPSRISFTIIDSVPPSPNYFPSATAADPSLLPSGNLSVALDPAVGWTLTATSAPNQSGSTTLTLQVTNNAGLVGTTVLPVTVSTQSFNSQLLNNSGYGFSSWGSAFWFLETTNTHSGGVAAQSGHIPDNAESWFGTSLIGPGRFIYWSKASSEPNFDYLDFFLDGVLQSNRLTGTNGTWQRFIFNIPQGTNALAWRYVKDKDTSRGLDAGWLDEMNFTSGVWLEILSSQPAGQSQFLLHGIPGTTYNLQSSTDFANWSTVLQITVPNTATPVTDTTPASGTRFYRLTQ
jgi:hypothetical protein